MVTETSVLQALVALAALLLFGVVARIKDRYPRKAQRLALLFALYVIGMALSNYPDRSSVRLGGFLMGGACVWLAGQRASVAATGTERVDT